jgi:peptidoglycan/LPS O-acetylase OafA/YrhL
LRGLAIILVLLSHFLPWRSPLIEVSCANLGVILFFFLSGFLMDRIYSAEPRLLPFIVRRGFRILPMYWLSVFLILLLGLDETGAIGAHHWTAVDAVANATFSTWPLHASRMSGVYWTLYIEILFYMLVPLLFILGWGAVVGAPIVLIAGYVIAWKFGVTVGAAPFYLIFCLAGMHFGLWHRGIINSQSLVLSIVTISIASSVLPIVSPLLGLAPIACALMLYAALTRQIEIGSLKLCGDVSYSWYLLHAIFGYIARDFALSLGSPAWTASLIGILISLALSLVTWLLIERPAIAFGAIAAGRYQPRPRSV